MTAFIDYSRKGARAKDTAAGDSSSPPFTSGDSSSATTASSAPSTPIEAEATKLDRLSSSEGVAAASNPARRKSVAFVETEAASRAPSAKQSAEGELQQSEAHRGVLFSVIDSPPIVDYRQPGKESTTASPSSPPPLIPSPTAPSPSTETSTPRTSAATSPSVLRRRSLNAGPPPPSTSPTASSPSQLTSEPQRGPRKLRRKSHASTTSPPSSPPTSPASFAAAPKPAPSRASQHREFSPSNKTTWLDSRRASGIVAAPPLASKWSDNEQDEQRAQKRPEVKSRDLEEVGSGLELTPQDRHYLNRIFVNLEIQKEASTLSQIGCLTQYGPPFLSQPVGPNSRPLDTSAPSGGLFSYFSGSGGASKGPSVGWEDYKWEEGKVEQSPVLKYLYWRFIYNLPALRLAKTEYWTDHIQPFWDSFAEKDLSTTIERSEVTKRRLLSMGFTRILGTYFSTCLPPAGRSAPSRPSVAVMRRIDHLVPGSMDSMWKTEYPDRPAAYSAWSAIVSEEEDRGEPAFRIVSRVLVVSPNPTYLVLRRWSAFLKLSTTLASLDSVNSLALPLLPAIASPDSRPSRTLAQQYLRSLTISLSAPPPDIAEDSSVLAEARTLLETFLLASSESADGTELEGWILAGEKEERAAEARRLKWVQAGREGKKLRTTWTMYRGALIEGDEIDKSIALVKKTSHLTALPESHRSAQIWAKIWVAYALHYLFVSSSHATEILNILKSFHDLLPYAAMKLGLSLVNPTLAIRAIVQIFLGQPVGQPSLFQRIFSIVCHGGIRMQKKLVDALRSKIKHESICDAVQKHVYASYAQRAATREAANLAKEDIVVSILREHGSQEELGLVKEWQAEFARAEQTKESTLEDGARSLFIDLKDLLAAYCRKRDREQVLELVMESNTPRILHASIAVFYDTIYKVANASNLAARLGDLQAFLNDLITTAFSDEKEPSDFIKLAARHEQQLYFFVHELASNGGTLLDPLIDWCKSGLSFIKDGIPTVPHSSSTSDTPLDTTGRAGVDYDQLLSTLPDEQQHAILAEARSLARWTRYRKAYSDICLRVDLLHVDGEGAGLNRDALYEQLLTQDRSVVNELRQRQAGAEGTLSWAWFAEGDVKGVADGERRKVEKQRQDKAERLSSKKNVSGGKRPSPAGGRVEEQDELESSESRGFEKQLPDPQVEATQRVVCELLGAVRESLEAARKAHLR